MVSTSSPQAAEIDTTNQKLPKFHTMLGWQISHTLAEKFFSTGDRTSEAMRNTSGKQHALNSLTKESGRPQQKYINKFYLFVGISTKLCVSSVKHRSTYTKLILTKMKHHIIMALEPIEGQDLSPTAGLTFTCTQTI